MDDLRNEVAIDDAISDAVIDWYNDGADSEVAEYVLSALEGAGFALYRPDDCMEVTIVLDGVGRPTTEPSLWNFPTGSRYRLVPVEGET